MHSFLKGMDFARSLKCDFSQMAIAWYGNQVAKDAKIELTLVDPDKDMATVNVTLPDYVVNGGIE